MIWLLFAILLLLAGCGNESVNGAKPSPGDVSYSSSPEINPFVESSDSAEPVASSSSEVVIEESSSGLQVSSSAEESSSSEDTEWSSSSMSQGCIGPACYLYSSSSSSRITIVCDEMVDERDGHVYQTIGIKSQMWMAENLNYADSVNYPSMLGRNWCLDDKDSCARYGRRYTWSAAIDSAYWSEQGITCGYGEPFCNLPNKVQGICPEGWHIPKKSEYIPHAECSTNCPGKIVSSDDEYGFSPILSVGVYRDGNFDLNLDNAYFWSASDQGGGSYASCWSVFPRDGAITGQKNEGISVRCVKDEE